MFGWSRNENGGGKSSAKSLMRSISRTNGTGHPQNPFGSFLGGLFRKKLLLDDEFSEKAKDFSERGRSGGMKQDTSKTRLQNITTLDGSDLKKIAPETVSARYLQLGHVIGHTQVWKWDGGDAIALVTNMLGEPPAGAVVIRVGDTVEVFFDVQGLSGAMRAMGLDPTSFQVV